MHPQQQLKTGLTLEKVVISDKTLEAAQAKIGTIVQQLEAQKLQVSIAFLGAPGSGKTTTINRLQRNLSTEYYDLHAAPGQDHVTSEVRYMTFQGEVTHASTTTISTIMQI